jgi:predicted acylesterase/phospholipase RssA
MAGRASTEPVSTVDGHRITKTVLGVFEGGGAKGALYAGALQAMMERNLWFSAVAGASAGAITAALVAAGMGPAEIRLAMPKGLEAMARPRALRGLWRVRKGVGYLDRERVRVWLRDELRKRFPQAPKDDVGGGPASGGGQTDPEGTSGPAEAIGPTFRELFEPSQGGTAIDLYVVALDLTGRHVMVFNHALTPDCPVADAVSASSAIPVAFETPVFLAVEEEGAGHPPSLSWRFVADGGLASNFPDFVFLDEGFRRYASLAPVPDGERIVGFLLDEDPQDQARLLGLYRQGSFLGSWSDLPTHLKRMDEEIDDPKEGARPTNGNAPAPPASSAEVPMAEDVATGEPGRRSVIGSVVWGLERAVWLPIGFLAWSSRGKTWPWNWPEPKSRHAKLLSEGLRQWFTSAPLQTIAGIVVFGVMFWIGFVALAPSLMPDLTLERVRDVGSIPSLAFGLVLTLAVIVIAAWVWLLGMGALLVMLVSYRTLGLIGHPLFRAFLYAPAAPPWAGCRPNETVIRLKVPKTITTMGVKPGTDLDAEIEAVRVSAFTQLGRVVHPSASDDGCP